MDNRTYNSKYNIWLYNLSAREYVILQNYFPKEHFNIVDIGEEESKFTEIDKSKILESPDIVICDEKTELSYKTKDILYDVKCGIVKVTLKNITAYTGYTFELNNDPIKVPVKKGDEFTLKNTTKVEESLKKIVELCQLSNIAKLHYITRRHSKKIKNTMDIDERIDNENLSSISKEYLFKLAKTLNEYISLKDHYTLGHSKRVSTYSEALGMAMNLSNNEIEDLVLASNLHDIGKIALPDAIITKTSGLTNFEFELMKKHVELGTSILPSTAYNNVKGAIRGHHERLDGSGYPDGLKGDEIPLFAQVIAIADSFDAMTSQRSYNKVKSAEEAFDDLLAHTKSKEDGGLGLFYNEELVKLFIKTLKNSKTIMDELEKQKVIADVIYENNKKLKSEKEEKDYEITNGGRKYA